MNELGLWRLLVLVGLLALTSPARAGGDVRVNFTENGPHWCWLRSAVGTGDGRAGGSRRKRNRSERPRGSGG